MIEDQKKQIDILIPELSRLRKQKEDQIEFQIYEGLVRKHAALYQAHALDIITHLAAFRADFKLINKLPLISFARRISRAMGTWPELQSKQ